MDDRVERHPLAELRTRELGLVANVICPFCQRATVMLHEVRADHARVELDFTDRPPWLLELSPEGKVPVLVVGQHAIFESRAIALQPGSCLRSPTASDFGANRESQT